MKTRSKTGAAIRPLTVAATILVVAAFSNALLAGCGGSKNEQSSNETSRGSTNTGNTNAPATSDTAGGGASAAGFDPAKTFAEKCSTCHGPEGRGDGPAGAA